MSGSETEWTAPPEAFLKKNTCYYCFKPLSIIYLFIYLFIYLGGGCGVASLVKNLYPMQNTPVRFLGRDDLLEKK